MLRVSGKSIVDSSGNPVILRGFGIGGWLHLENFMTGFPGQETPMRQAMLQAMGQEAYDAFYDSYYQIILQPVRHGPTEVNGNELY